MPPVFVLIFTLAAHCPCGGRRAISPFGGYLTHWNKAAMALTRTLLDEFQDGAHLLSAHFELKLEFKRSDEKWTNCVFIGVGLKGATLAKMDIKFAKFRHCYLRGSTLERCDFTGSEFVDCNLRNVKWENCKLEYVSFTRCDLDYGEIIQCLPDNNYMRRRLLRSLRINALSMGDTRQADRLLLMEMDADWGEQKDILFLASDFHRARYGPSDRLKAFSRLVVHAVESLVWGYGVKLRKILVFCLILLGLSSTSLWAIGAKLSVNDGASEALDFWMCAYVASVTFSTLGFGDVVPCDFWGRFVLSLTGLAGPVCLGLFVAAAYRRIQR